MAYFKTTSPVKYLWCILLLISFNTANSKTATAEGQCGNTEKHVYVKGKCTQIETFKSKNLSTSPKLLIVLHGDAPFHNPSYQYRFAKQIASSSEDLVAVGMLRPGYTDEAGRTSDGIKGDAVGDNYDNARVRQLSEAITKLKAQYNASQMLLVGHSGGAAMSAKMIALEPNLIDHVFLIACPCNINAWRSDMYELTKIPVFNGDIDIQSPTEMVEKISPETRVYVVFGEKDKAVKPYIAEEYFNLLFNSGISVQKLMVNGGHEILEHQQVLNLVLGVLSSKSGAVANSALAN